MYRTTIRVSEPFSDINSFTMDQQVDAEEWLSDWLKILDAATVGVVFAAVQVWNEGTQEWVVAD